MNASPASDLAVRRTGIGGSDIAALVGEDPFGRTEYDVFLEKRGEAPPRDDIGEAGHWGNILEEPVAQEAARRMGIKIARVNRSLVHEQYPFIIGHIDRRIVGARAGMEVKTTSFFNGPKSWDVEDAGDIPTHVMLQVQHYMELADFDYMVVPVLIGGQRLEIFNVERDRNMGAMIVEIAVRFWREHVETGIEPPPSTAEEVRRRFPAARALAVEATPYVAQCVELLANSKARIKALERDVETAQDAIAAHLAEHDTLTINGQPAVTFKTQTSRRVDLDGLRAAHPGLCEQFVRESSTRVMRLQKGFK